MPVEETVRGFKEIVDGEHDEIPERAFYMKGSIDQVLEDARSAREDEEGRGARGRRGRGVRRGAVAVGENAPRC